MFFGFSDFEILKMGNEPKGNWVPLSPIFLLYRFKFSSHKILAVASFALVGLVGSKKPVAVTPAKS